MDGLKEPLLIMIVIFQCSFADPNFKNVFKQTTKEVQNEALTDITGTVPKWLSGDFVRQICASYGDIDGKLLITVCYSFSQ